VPRGVTYTFPWLSRHLLTKLVKAESRLRHAGYLISGPHPRVHLRTSQGLQTIACSLRNLSVNVLFQTWTVTIFAEIASTASSVCFHSRPRAAAFSIVSSHTYSNTREWNAFEVNGSTPRGFSASLRCIFHFPSSCEIVEAEPNITATPETEKSEIACAP
jgi:hypothetical protein